MQFSRLRLLAAAAAARARQLSASPLSPPSPAAGGRVSFVGAPFSQGQTTVVPQSAVSVDEEMGKKLITLQSGASLSNLVNGLNALGVTPRDMISILQAIKAAGALQADIQVM